MVCGAGKPNNLILWTSLGIADLDISDYWIRSESGKTGFLSTGAWRTYNSYADNVYSVLEMVYSAHICR